MKNKILIFFSVISLFLIAYSVFAREIIIGYDNKSSDVIKFTTEMIYPNCSTPPFATKKISEKSNGTFPFNFALGPSPCDEKNGECGVRGVQLKVFKGQNYLGYLWVCVGTKNGEVYDKLDFKSFDADKLKFTKENYLEIN